MVYQQIYDITASMYKQATGKEAVITTNAQFVDVGRQVLSSDDTKSAWYKVFVDRIGRTVNAVRAYRAQGAEMARQPIEMGAILQKISMNLLEPVENTTWFSQDDDHSDPFRKGKVKPVQKFFQGGATWEFDLTVPDVQLESAFLSPEAMAAYISMCFTTMYNSQEVAYQNNANLCRASFVARKVGKPTMINVVDLYNKEYPEANMTAEKAKTDKEFLRFLTKTISLYADRLTVMSSTFNDEGMDRHTPHDLQVITVLADIEKAFTSILQSDTYHDDLVKITGSYTTVPYWQGSGTEWAWNDVSTINVYPKGYTEAQAFKVTDIVAMIYDREAIGITIDKRRTKSMYNPADEYTTFFAKAEVAYYNDMSENGIIFTLSTPTAPVSTLEYIQNPGSEMMFANDEEKEEEEGE